MPEGAPPQSVNGTSDRLKVFISYSRDDVDFAEETKIALEDKGHEVLMDRHSIAKGEEFKKRLEGMLLSCDTVVFLLTDHSAQSETCAWEVETARRLPRRILAVTIGDLSEGVNAPEGLAGIDWIHCWRNPKVPGSSQTLGFRELDKTLRSDVDWLRQRTDLQEQTVRWTADGAAKDSPRLLRDALLAEAQTWARRAPKHERVPDNVARFLAASEDNEARLNAETAANIRDREDALARAEAASRRVRSASFIGAGVAGLFLLVASLAGWFAWQGNIEVQRGRTLVAEGQSNILARESAVIHESGDHATALLMALQADPAGQSENAATSFNEANEGNYRARTRLAASYDAMALARIFGDHNLAARHAAFSQNGKYVVSASGDGEAVVFNAESGEVLHSIDGRSRDGYTSLSSTDGQFVVTGAAGASEEIWDIETGEMVHSFDGDRIYIATAAFPPSGELVASASSDATAAIWDLQTGQRLHLLEGHSSRVASISFSPDGESVVSASLDDSARIWDVGTGELIHLLKGQYFRPSTASGRGVVTVTGELGGKSSGFNSAAFSSDGRFVVTGSSDFSARIWDAANGELLETLSGHSADVVSARFSPDDEFVVTASVDGTARIWSATYGREVSRIEGVGVGLEDASFSPDGRFVLTASSEVGVRLWSLEPRLFTLRLVSGDDDGFMSTAAYSPDGEFIVTTSESKVATIWNVANGEIVRRLVHPERVDFANYSADGKFVATEYGFGFGRLWDAASGEVIRELDDSRDPEFDRRASPDGKLFLGMTENLRLGVFDFEIEDFLFDVGGQPLAWEPNSFAFSPDGKAIVAGMNDRSVRVFHAVSGGELRRFQGHDDRILSARVSRDGRRVVTASNDQTVRVWDVATGDEVLRISEENFYPQYADFSPSGDIVVAAASSTLVWRLPEILRADAKTQVKLACEKLWAANAPLAFSKADIARYPVLEGQPEDPNNPDMLASPCKGVLPEEAFASSGQ